MRLSFLPVYKREIRAYFQNPGVYVTLAILIWLAGLLTYQSVRIFRQQALNPMRFQYGQGPLNYNEWIIEGTFHLLSFLFMFIIPLITMRLFAEEKKSGTFELLATCPVTDWGLLIGKYLAAVSVVAVFLAVSFTILVTLSRVGETEWPVVATGYVSLLLLGIAYAAFGVFASTLTENQIIAGVVTFCGLLGFYVIDYLGYGGTGLFSRICDALSVSSHTRNLISGRVLLEDLVYFFAFATGFLFLANHVLESRRWRV